MLPQNAELLERLGVALALGLLIGLERGWEFRQLPEGGRVAGLRTFGLISLLGGLAVQLGGPAHELFLAAALLGVAMLMALGYWRETRDQPDLSITTAVAALVAFALGALAGLGELTLAAATAVVVTFILGFKAELHSLVFNIERPELTATLRLLLISVVILPILPNRGMGPWASFNPYEIWWMVVMIAGISYVGYFAIKILGEERGIMLTGFFGGLVSSTAVALTMSPQANANRKARDLVAAAILCASATMFPRMFIIAAIIAPNLMRTLAWPLGAAAVLSFAAAGWFAWRAGSKHATGTGAELRPRNPLDLWFAVKFGAALAVIMIVARAAKVLFGNRGLFLFSGISGLVDVDAITLSVSSMLNQGQARLDAATVAILIPATINTMVKPAIMTFMAGFGTALRVWVALLVALAAGALAFWLAVLR
jgi:uncharacterized membrane protein (DUF4010 family)